MLNKFRLLLPILLIMLITGCAQNEASSNQLDYEQTKKMVVDILKTDEGKKAIQDLMTEDKIKQQLIMDQKIVTDTIEKTLTSEKGAEFWKKQLEDPKFAESMAKSLKTENEKLLKDLMKDPEYRGMMVEVMQDPELEKEVTKILKSKEYREHLQTVIKETLESPLYKAKIQEIILKATEEVKSGKKGEEKGGGAEEQDKQGGGSQ